MKPLFVTATGTDVGKTYVTLQLIEHFASRDLSVGVCKPIETGVVDEPVDATALLVAVQGVNRFFEGLSPKDITAYTFELPAAPFSADRDKTIKIDQIMEKIARLSQQCELLIIEGAGGLMVPVTENFMMIDLIEKSNAEVLLVTPSRLGCINDTLLSIEALDRRNISYDWCVNLYDDRESFGTVTQPYYDARFKEWWSTTEGLEQFVEHYIQVHASTPAIKN